MTRAGQTRISRAPLCQSPEITPLRAGGTANDEDLHHPDGRPHHEDPRRLHTSLHDPARPHHPQARGHGLASPPHPVAGTTRHPRVADRATVTWMCA
ncbi:uncharacterized protein SCHCODRAFT_02607824 [Schizophyllum commune H4-8]|uniref:uncharacterized protein n=1 Tax=Schizophyllum commune (strain H4-8 / FGSC 9210) TaxID=578458 RepID=UPI00215FD0A1|nr:uncharacterized protein SCHCODRAFT_02607824 [Schizophyllum commune H4-8]KAI5900411.1 hypothetical protein SCHCODRAFT_02607824 [Schizophyllum commune H4-8]